MGQLAIIDAGAAAHQVGDRQAGQCGQDGGGGRRIGDAHVTGADDIQAAGDLGLNDFDASFKGLDGLFAGHGRSVRHAFCAVGNFLIDKLRVGGHIDRHAHIHDNDAGAGMAGQGVDGRAAVQEIRHHLGGDFLGEGADAVSHDAVISGHGDDDFVLDGREGLTGDPGDLDGEGFQAAEAAGWLGEGILTSTGGRGGHFIERFDTGDRFSEHVHSFFKSICAGRVSGTCGS